MQDLAPENALPSDPKARWQRLSPLLDELLDMEPTARAARLAAMQDLAPELAAELERLLAQDAALEAQGFLAQPALPPTLSAVVALPGQTVGAYRLEREIGHGGMGSVWLARRTDGRFEGLVAIKFLTSGLLGQGDAARFAREGQILARLTHPHIARLIDAGVAQDGLQPYLVLEYVEEGLPIDRFCESRQLDTAQRITLFLDVLAAVAHAHNRLILHRDLKPGNILVDRQGQVKLLDFGIAKLLGDPTQALGGAEATELTRQAGRAFTPQFAAPEQVQGGDVSTATDVYALGVLLYLLLSGGKHPTAGATRAEAQALDRLRAVVEEEPKRLSDQLRSQGEARRARELRGDLDTICAKALKKRPSERYENAAALAEDLRRWLQHEPIAARPDSRLYVLGRFLRRHRLAVGAGSVAVSALLGLTGLSVLQAQRAAAAEQQAQTRRQQADDLLAYMLGDFADKLRPIGRLELLDNVGGKALSHLAAAKEQASPQERLHRAKALTVIGEVRVSKRELEAAIEPLQQANALLQAEPPTPELVPAWRKAQGAAAFWLGHVYYTQRKFAPAQRAWERYREVSEQWLAVLPQDLDGLVELSYAENSLGSLLLDQGRVRTAEQAFRRSVALKSHVLAQRPNDATLQAEWSESLSWLGSSLLQMGRYVQAQAVFRQALEQAQDLRTKYPADQAWLRKVGHAANRLADALWRDGQPRAATEHFVLATEAFRTLSALDPQNRAWTMALIRAEAGVLRGQASQIRAVEDLQRRLAALEAGRTPLARLHPLRAELVQLHAQALRHKGQDLAAAQVLVENTLAQLRRDKIAHGADLTLSQAMLELSLFQAETLSVDPAQRTARCQALWAELSSAPLAALLREHAGFTRLAVRTQTCLGRAEEARALQQWLDAQHRWASSPPQPVPPKAVPTS
ncbi:MAG: protein kinase domain-containing protein [Roseateles asaccharophilus]|uniref:protein kinase domain-containing protein n=1 Tax=Roseateles asaccharophilus TaxID=582607 RepID=UPI00391DD1A1